MLTYWVLFIFSFKLLSFKKEPMFFFGGGGGGGGRDADLLIFCSMDDHDDPYYTYQLSNKVSLSC